MTIEEAADVLRVHRNTVERMLKRGELDGFKTAGEHGHWRIRATMDGLPVVLRKPRGDA